MADTTVRGYRLTAWTRALLAGWCLFLAAGFALAASLEPDSRGFGTHQRLGLPPCSVRVLFGVPCPSCGGTTAFANFVRGRWLASLDANAGAFLLALSCAAMLPWSGYSAWRGVLWKVEQPATTLLGLLLALCSVSLAQWLARLM